MPELPEVETVVKDLNSKKIIRQKIIAVDILYPKLIITPNFAKKVINKKITSILRRGKYIVINLNDEKAIVVHLKMSGHFIHSKKVLKEKHIHVIFTLQNGEKLYFHDVRKFGRFYLIDDCSQFFKNMGPEPLSNDFSEKWLFSKLQEKKKNIKGVLVDQNVIAGIGNIYCDEILFAAKINPTRVANSLSQSEVKKLFVSIRKVLKRGIKNRGTSLGSGIANFSSIDRRPGENQKWLQAYGRKDLPCFRCQSKIKKIKLNQRGTYFCPNCQRVSAASTHLP